ncbi:50S ribosomal protein L29 [Intestinicryptomonas porci]|uniref:Large ribosomal subunit protein uL29 n=1 Tax=Intestinicryptomonas porci TaxID=2926320 RepID=A0ABU4WDG8_9BACT|nr:50S ribosomal protein L29 [Opitutales bacterium]MDX8414600.1 50S ribosomal protein L29 [Opitutales bacterium CLA-KB-P66]
MKSKDIRELSVEELDKKLREMRDELLGLNIRKRTGQVENTGRIRVLRRDIARFETIKSQKK